jgi:hypothetical protein
MKKIILAACAALAVSPALASESIGLLCQERYEAPGLPIDKQTGSTTYKLELDKKTATVISENGSYTQNLVVTDETYTIGEDLESKPAADGLITHYYRTTINRLTGESINGSYSYLRLTPSRHLFLVSVHGLCKPISATPVL